MKAVVPKKKKKTEDEKVDLPANLDELIIKTIQDSKSKLTAEKIIEAIKEEFRAVNDVTFLTVIADLYRRGHLSENKSHYTVEEDVLEQLKPPVVIELKPQDDIEIIEDEEDKKESEEAAIEIEDDAVEVAEEKKAESIETEEAAANTVDAPVSIEGKVSVAKESAAKDVAAEATKSASKSVAKETSTAASVSAKKSVAKEDSTSIAAVSTKKSTTKEAAIVSANVSAKKSTSKTSTTKEAIIAAEKSAKKSVAKESTKKSASKDSIEEEEIEVE